ncbi:MAG: hypothetical protein GKR98_03385 [Boseongicola sp.]|nr:MAG: hypothetical protein GKR98_03385 [Boseongicola sp.]
MPDWDQYKTEAKARGSLAFELFVVVSTPAKTPEDLKANLPAHLQYQGSLEADGKLAFAGPMSDETGTQMQGVGLMVYRAGSFDEARKIAEADPMHTTGTVRRQGFGNQELLKQVKSLARLVDVIMRRAVCDASAALRASFV